ncbi:MAG: RHS repeat-associated core domain-containing protein [bacterium]
MIKFKLERQMIERIIGYLTEGKRLLIFGLLVFGSLVLFSPFLFSQEHIDLVDTSNGSLNLGYTDLMIPGVEIDLYFARLYNNQSESNGILGWGWHTLWDMNLKYRPPEERKIITMVKGVTTVCSESLPCKLELIGGNGKGLEFRKEGEGFISIYGEDIKITKSDNGFIMIYNDGTKYFFEKPAELEKIPNVSNYQRILKEGGVEITSFSERLEKRGIYKLSMIKDRFENKISFFYDYLNRLIKVQDETTKRGFSFTYTAKDKISRVKDHTGRSVSFKYDYQDNLIEVMDILGRKTSFLYDTEHNIKSIIKEGASLKISYDLNKRVVRLKGPSKEDTSFFYEDIYEDIGEINSGMITTIQDVLGNKIVHCYKPGYYGDNAKRMVITDAEGNKKEIYRNKRKLIEKIIYPNGAYWEYTYDDRGNLTQRSGPEGVVWKYEYEKVYNRLSRIIDPKGGITNLTYDGSSSVKIEYPDKNFTTTIYNSFGKPIKIINTRKKEAEYSYNDYGELTQIKIGSRTATFSYDQVGRLTSFTNPNKVTTDFTYNNANKLTEVKDGLSNLTKYTYDGRGNLVSITDPLNRTIFFEYDASDRLIKITGREGAVLRYSYDKIGNLVSLTDPAGNVFSYSYDKNRRRTQVNNPQGGIIRYGYDPSGNLTKTIDACGNSTEYTYDKLGRLIKVCDENGGESKYTYDKMGNFISLTNANGHSINYTYDSVDRLIEMKNPLGNTIYYTYDVIGNLIEKKDAMGLKISYIYDDFNQMVRAEYPDSSLKMGYDNNGNLIDFSSLGLSGSMTYDNLDRMTTLIYNYGSFTKKLNYSYDSLNNLGTLREEGKGVINYTYDALNRTTSISNEDGKINYSYDSLGRRTKMTYPNGVFCEYSYNALSQITSIVYKKPDNKTISFYNYTYDRNGNVLSMTTPEGRFFYEYDKLNRLIREVTPSGTNTAYTYDKVGNRLSMNGIDYTYDNAERLIKAGITSYVYDNNGNMIKKTSDFSTTTYSYDYGNRLTGVFCLNDNIGSYTYSPLGYRIRKMTGTETITYLWNRKRLLGEYDDSGNLKTSYILGARNEAIGMKRGTATTYFLSDLIGNIIGLIDQNGNQIASLSYEPFGRVRSKRGEIEPSLLFTGAQFDSEIGLYYMKARHYDPEIGRFLQKEPMDYVFLKERIEKFSIENRVVNGRAFGFYNRNYYDYVGNNPLLFIDPDGLARILGGGEAGWNVGGGLAGQTDIGYDFSGEGGFVEPSIYANVGIPQAGVCVNGGIDELFGKNDATLNLGVAALLKVDFAIPLTHVNIFGIPIPIPNGIRVGAGLGVSATIVHADVDIPIQSTTISQRTVEGIVEGIATGNIIQECQSWTFEQRYENADRIRTEPGSSVFDRIAARNRMINLLCR